MRDEDPRDSVSEERSGSEEDVIEMVSEEKSCSSWREGDVISTMGWAAMIVEFCLIFCF